MMTIIIFALIGIVVSWYKLIRSKGHNYVEEYVLNAIIGCTVGGTVGVLVALLMPSKTRIEYSEIKIVALQDGNSVTGSFFLGSGNVDGEMYYTYYSDNGDSTYSLNKIHYRLADIKYTTSKPRLLIQTVKFTDDWYNSFAMPVRLNDTYRVFEVPSGSIKNNYNLDAQ